jgi:hypothetical protein
MKVPLMHQLLKLLNLRSKVKALFQDANDQTKLQHYKQDILVTYSLEEGSIRESSAEWSQFL